MAASPLDQKWEWISDLGLGSPASYAAAMLDTISGPMESGGRSLERRDEWQRILSLNAKPEAGVVAKIGMGLMLFKAHEAKAYVVGATQVPLDD
jgi:hypothetical protein